MVSRGRGEKRKGLYGRYLMEPPKNIKIVSESEFYNTIVKKDITQELHQEYNFLLYSVVIVCIVILIYKFY